MTTTEPRLDPGNSMSGDANVDPFERVITELDANFGAAPNRRAAHAKGVVVTGSFAATPEAANVSRAGHFQGGDIPVVVRFSNFPGGPSHPDAAPESNPRGLAVQFRLPNGSSTDLLAHSINGFPGRTVDDFSDFLHAISPAGGGPEQYLATHEAAAKFVAAIQSHGTPSSYATVRYYPVNAFRFFDAHNIELQGRYEWEPLAGTSLLDDAAIASAAPDFMADELVDRLERGTVQFALMLTIAAPDDATDDANDQWPADRQRINLGTMTLDTAVENSGVAEQGLSFDPVRLVDGIDISDDPLLVGRTRTYPLSLARRHDAG